MSRCYATWLAACPSRAFTAVRYTAGSTGPGSVESGPKRGGREESRRRKRRGCAWRFLSVRAGMGASLNSDRRRRQAPRRFLLFGISFRLAPNARRKGAGMFVLSVELRIKPENVESFMAKALENAAQSRKEPGCRQFEVLVDPKEPTRAMLYEVYVDEKAFDAHQQTAHFKKYLAEAVPLLATRERHVWKRAAP